MQNGARPGWLIDVEERQVFIYRTGRDPEKISGLHQPLNGEAVMPGFRFDLSCLRMP